jgi:type IV pilus assembly protein PilB
MFFRKRKDGNKKDDENEKAPLEDRDEQLDQEQAAPLEEAEPLSDKQDAKSEEELGTYRHEGKDEVERSTSGLPDDLLRLGQSLGLRVVRLRDYVFTKETRDLIGREYALKYRALPLERQNGKLVIALEDPHNFEALDDLQSIYGDIQIEQVIADREDVGDAIERYYRSDALLVSEMMTQTKEDKEKELLDQEMDQADTGGVDPDDEGQIKQLVDLILNNAYKERASDIHFECYENDFRVRYRIDGVCHDRESPGMQLRSAVMTRLKLVSGMDLAEKRIPQDGRIQMMIGDKVLDFRVSALPSMHGESIVLRLLESASVMRGLADVGFLESNIEVFNELIRKPNGIILLTGPTGSGKTTTLYSAISVINNVDTKIITVENPVEYQIEGVNQMQVNEEIGLTFALGLRAILRQAPDVILVGEIRDLETAEIAVTSALTGHLVFSTLHTNDAPGATTRLIEMGIAPYMVCSSLQAVIAQRLVRRICRECRETYPVTPAEVREFGMDPDMFENVMFHRGRGCDYCSHTGYRGRTAVHEIMIMTEEIRDMVTDRKPAETIRVLAREQGMRTLREDGWEKVRMGMTTTAEVLRVTAGDEG